jgi:hypothetical protein
MNKPLISIIVPIYNVEKYLAECVTSLLKQTYSNVEIILVDDGSTDQSGKLCDEYASSHENVVVIHQKNAGVSQARNNGMLYARGEWITFCDSDDWCDVRMCEKIVHRITDETDILIWGFSYFENGQFKSKEKIEDSLVIYKGKDVQIVQLDLFTKRFDNRFVDDTNIIMGTCWGKLYRKSIIVNHNITFSDGLHPHEDSFFNFLAFQNAREIHFLHESYNFYRIISTSGCQRYKPKEGMCIHNAVRLLQQYIKQYNYSEDERFQTAFSLYCLDMLRIFLKNLVHRDNPQNVEERIQNLKEFIESDDLRNYLLSSSSGLRLGIKDRMMLLLVRFRQYGLLYNLKK